MRKIRAFILVIIYILTTFGMPITYHFCEGKLASMALWQWNLNHAKCFCKIRCNHGDTKTCCKVAEEDHANHCCTEIFVIKKLESQHQRGDFEIHLDFFSPHIPLFHQAYHKLIAPCFAQEHFFSQVYQFLEYAPPRLLLFCISRT